MKFGQQIVTYQEEIIRSLTELVAIPSVRSAAEEGMPFGAQSAAALRCALETAERLGLSTKNVSNYAGHAEYGEGEEVAAVVAHVDVVPAGEGWNTDPFTLTRKGNLYFGRGAADDKGAAVAALYCLKALKDAGVKGKRRLRVILGAGEETGSNDLQRYLASEQMPVMAFTPDAEYGICNREKGILRLAVFAEGNDSTAVRSISAGTVVNAVPAKAEASVRCTDAQMDALKAAARNSKAKFTFARSGEEVRILSLGKSSHAMQPQEGLNAAAYLAELLASVYSPEQLGAFLRFVHEKVGTELDGASLGIRREDPESGPLTLNLGLLHIGADSASAGIDIRYPVTAKGEEIFSVISARAAEYGLKAVLNADTKPLFLPESSPFISLLKGSYKAVTGKEATIYATGGGTYARAFGGRAVAFGPFFPDEPDRRLHNTNENIDIERFMQHAQVCLEAMYRMMTE